MYSLHAFIKPYGNIGEINFQITAVYINRNRLVKSVYNRVNIALEEIDQYLPLCKINYPILPHPGFHILRQLERIVLLLCGGRNHLNNEVRSTVYAKSLNLGGIAHNTHIRLNHGLLSQSNCTSIGAMNGRHFLPCSNM